MKSNENAAPASLRDYASKTAVRAVVTAVFTLGIVMACTERSPDEPAVPDDVSASLAVPGNGFVANAHLPNDAEATCTADIAGWFSGPITANGWVNPANSLNPVFADFDNNTRCDFYRWGAQMFLWLTSKPGATHVFNTPPVFYSVSVADSAGNRTFIATDGPMQLAVRKSKTDDEIELGQAGGGDVLLTQNNSLVYYGLHANDLYALYTTGRKNADPVVSTIKNFPATSAELAAVVEYAEANDVLISDEVALALELKTSWVDATTVNRNDYVLAQAVVPVFDRQPIDPNTGKQQWTITDNEEKTLALVGIHIVGTVNAHPEMVWATFEHVNNVPDATYSYKTAASGNPVASQPYNSSGTWNFIQSNAAAPTALTANGVVSDYNPPDKNNPRKCMPTGSSNAECLVNTTDGVEIDPIDVLRAYPWGNDEDGSFGPSNTSSASAAVDNTTDLVSINVSVLSQLSDGDVRGNYIQTGGIWTAKGQIPPNGNSANLRGSLNLANTTMETFYQFYHAQQKAFNPKNCFGCHGSDPTDATGISHIYDHLQPLFPKR